MSRALGLMAVVAALAVAASAGAAPRPGFAPGTWVGNGVQKGIFTVVPGDPSPVDGTARFVLKVDRSSRATGTMTIRVRMPIDYAGLRGTVTGVASTALSGSAADVRFAGTMKLSGTLSDGTMQAPFAVAKPVRGRLAVGRATCLAVVGTTTSYVGIKWRAVPKPGTRAPRCA